METITTYWSIIVSLPAAGAFIVRQFYARWPAWIVGLGMSLIAFLAIRLIGHKSSEYAIAALIGMWLVGALLPEIGRGVSAAVQAGLSRPRNVAIVFGGVAIIGLYIFNLGMLYYITCLGLVVGAIYLILRSLFRGPH